MPRRKPKPEKVIEEKIKESLDSIIMDESLDSVSLNTEDLPRLKSTELMDFSSEKLTALSDAQSLLDSISSFYVDPNVHGTLDHIELKKKMDSMNLSAMLFQLKSAQHAITKLLEEIDLGNMHPRIFEVLAQLQSQIMQMPKDYQAYVEKMEQNYKKSKIEIEEKRSSGGVLFDPSDGSINTGANSITSPGGIRSRGTRGLMEGLRDILGSEIVDIKPIDVNSNAVVNARDKKIMDSKEPQEGGEDPDINYTIEDNILE